MSRKIKAIQTVYKGHKFRSRLEARWAVFFDELNIEWMYEPEGYELNDGSWYLPDFYLPHFNKGLYCEVKFDGGDFSKARMFNETTGLQILECEGVPDYCGYKINFCNEIEENWGIFHPKYIFGYEHKLHLDTYDNFGKKPKNSKVCLDPEFLFHITTKRHPGEPGVANAIAKAKQARFDSKKKGSF